MKNRGFLAAMGALVFVCLLVLAGCGSNSPDDNPYGTSLAKKDLVGSWCSDDNKKFFNVNDDLTFDADVSGGYGGQTFTNLLIKGRLIAKDGNYTLNDLVCTGPADAVDETNKQIQQLGLNGVMVVLKGDKAQFTFTAQGGIAAAAANTFFGGTYNRQ